MTSRQKPVRVFHLIKGLGRGGAETLLVETLRSSDPRRFEFGYGFFLRTKDALAEDLVNAGGNVVCFDRRGPMRMLFSAWQVANHLRRWKTEVLHCHLPLSGVVGRIAGHIAGIPVVYSEHNELERYHFATRRMNVATWSLQHQAVAVSHEVAASISRHVRSAVPVEVVHNGVDVSRFDPQLTDGKAVRKLLGIPVDAPVVGTVAVFRIQKRLDWWLEAAFRVRERDPAAHFIIVGDGVFRDELVKQTASLELGDRVHFVGLQKDVRPYLAAMDVYMISSAVEGLPVALLEAMAMGRPIASTDVGGISEAIKDGKTGLLTPPGQPARLASAVSQLLAGESLRAEFGTAARRQVKEHFSVHSMTRKLDAIYSRLAARETGASQRRRRLAPAPRIRDISSASYPLRAP